MAASISRSLADLKTSTAPAELIEPTRTTQTARRKFFSNPTVSPSNNRAIIISRLPRFCSLCQNEKDGSPIFLTPFFDSLNVFVKPPWNSKLVVTIAELKPLPPHLTGGNLLLAETDTGLVFAQDDWSSDQ